MYFQKFILVMTVTVLVSGGQLNASQSNEQQQFDKSVILIRCVHQDFDYVTPWEQKAMQQSIGTGFVIAGNKILTNAHNISNSKYIELKKQNTAKRYPARVGFAGHDCDLATIIPEDESFFDDTVALELAGIPRVNSTVSTYGFPIGGNRISVTEGVVSRIEEDTYVHSGADSHLVIQTDASINPGNSGGPVIQEGKVVGVAFQGLRIADNIGYMIPTTVIRHFLVDIEDGKYDGFGSLGVLMYPGLHSASYKDYLKVPPQEEGMIVIDTMMHSSVESILQANDVITAIDGYNIDNDGLVEIYGLQLHMSEVIETKHIGQKAELTFYRDGKLMKKTATVALNRPILEQARQYDKSPRYVCFAGLTFVPITRNYLESWGRKWRTDIPHSLRYLFMNSIQLNTDRERKEYVVLAEVLPDEVNTYAADFRSQPVESINGVRIWGLEDVYKAFAQDVDDFYSIKFMGDNRQLPIDAKNARLRHQLILNKYQIPVETRLEETL
ncbi:MAG: trypsin-like peptidase domain-containing protein [Sedimentisphaerales bacterium]|nr:trypsin-like peptidase domain-containing protein [Sedimentisphaerales bacterium]